MDPEPDSHSGVTTELQVQSFASLCLSCRTASDKVPGSSGKSPIAVPEFACPTELKVLREDPAMLYPEAG
ncbi:hypothetical protein CDV36_012082 [Fusarium kuroshium]|uniref:Uncharacterized protein n=1 Tax=Fusarium kuroshium TaxID=2010991 RepID=A0A3M2RSK9_9HYPO|nr:hypothetical protein CDV36_012082 [Fusarium kuroshium]